MKALIAIMAGFGLVVSQALLPVTVLHFDKSIEVGYGVERDVGQSCDQEIQRLLWGGRVASYACYTWQFSQATLVISNLRSRFVDNSYEFLNEEPYNDRGTVWLEQRWSKQFGRSMKAGDMVVKLWIRPLEANKTRVLVVVFDQSIRPSAP